MSHVCHMQYARRGNNRTMVLHEIVEIVNHVDDVRRRGHCTRSSCRHSRTNLRLITHVDTMCCCPCCPLLPQFYNRLTAFKVRMALIEVKAYTSSNPISVTGDPSATLTSWKTHFRNNIHQVVPADAALLFA